MGLLASPIRRKLEIIKENANKLNGYISELLEEIKEEEGHPLRAKIKDEWAIFNLEKDEYKAVLKIQNKAIEASTIFRQIYKEAPSELKHELSALRKIYELIQQINREVVAINNTPQFHEINNSAVRIADWADQALENIDEVYNHIHEHFPVYSNWATKHFST